MAQVFLLLSALVIGKLKVLYRHNYKHNLSWHTEELGKMLALVSCTYGHISTLISLYDAFYMFWRFRFLRTFDIKGAIHGISERSKNRAHLRQKIEFLTRFIQIPGLLKARTLYPALLILYLSCISYFTFFDSGKRSILPASASSGTTSTLLSVWLPTGIGQGRPRKGPHLRVSRSSFPAISLCSTKLR
jgi:hypothetical protein